MFKCKENLGGIEQFIYDCVNLKGALERTKQAYYNKWENGMIIHCVDTERLEKEWNIINILMNSILDNLETEEITTVLAQITITRKDGLTSTLEKESTIDVLDIIYSIFHDSKKDGFIYSYKIIDE
jgi:hypothetical protein